MAYSKYNKCYVLSTGISIDMNAMEYAGYLALESLPTDATKLPFKSVQKVQNATTNVGNVKINNAQITDSHRG